MTRCVGGVGCYGPRGFLIPKEAGRGSMIQCAVITAAALVTAAVAASPKGMSSSSLSLNWISDWPLTLLLFSSSSFSSLWTPSARVRVE